MLLWRLSMNLDLIYLRSKLAGVAQLVELLTCNEGVARSIRAASLNEATTFVLDRYPSGQRGQTVQKQPPVEKQDGKVGEFREPLGLVSSRAILSQVPLLSCESKKRERCRD